MTIRICAYIVMLLPIRELIFGYSNVCGRNNASAVVCSYESCRGGGRDKPRTCPKHCAFFITSPNEWFYSVHAAWHAIPAYCEIHSCMVVVDARRIAA